MDPSELLGRPINSLRSIYLKLGMKIRTELIHNLFNASLDNMRAQNFRISWCQIWGSHDVEDLIPFLLHYYAMYDVAGYQLLRGSLRS